MKRTNEPYFNAAWGWKFVNIVHLLALKQLEEPGHPLTVTASSISPNTLKQRLFGGRKYIVWAIHDFEFDGLRDVCNQTVFRPSGLSGMQICPTDQFGTAYMHAQQSNNAYLNILTTANVFIPDTSSSIMTLPAKLSVAQQEGLEHFFKVRPVLKASIVSDTIVVLRKVG